MTVIVQKVGRGEIEVYCSKVLLCEVVYYLKVDCNKLKMYVQNPKETTWRGGGGKQTGVVNKSLKEIKLNHKNV